MGQAAPWVFRGISFDFAQDERRIKKHPSLGVRINLMPLRRADEAPCTDGMGERAFAFCRGGLGGRGRGEARCGAHGGHVFAFDRLGGAECAMEQGHLSGLLLQADHRLTHQP